MSADNGGPAFPCMPPQDTAAGVAVGYPFPDSGMTLRDYFAAKAMQGLLAQPLGTALESDPILGAQYAYRVADAMLAVRRETKR